MFVHVCVCIYVESTTVVCDIGCLCEVILLCMIKVVCVKCFCLSCRELWRREAGIDQTIQNARDELTKCERNLRGTMGKVSGNRQGEREREGGRERGKEGKGEGGGGEGK